MEDIDRFFELGHVKCSKRPAFIPNQDFPDSGSDGRHQLPIIRLFPLLDFEELKTSRFLCTVRKLAKISA